MGLFEDVCEVDAEMRAESDSDDVDSANETSAESSD
jgi:hypothetical protein